MSENAVRHIIAICGTAVGFLAWFSGYISGTHGWWWSALSLLILYVIIYKLVDA
jgi:hypothetical protein